MLSDAQIERWSRQILVPEIGGRGQARLCAATVEVVGAPALATLLIERAGPRVTTGAPDVAVRWTSTARGEIAPSSKTATPTVVARLDGTAALVTAVVASPCTACVVVPAPAGASEKTAAAAALASATERVVAALVAAEVVRLLVVPNATGRVHRIDLAAGSFTAEPARAAGDCAVCGAAA